MSGGIYGNEELVLAAPPLYVFVFTLGAALLFALPNALLTAELSTAFPKLGGQVAWVHDCCGPALGVQNAYWVWLTNLVDAAIYPQLAANYIISATGGGAGLAVPISYGMVLIVLALNLAGLQLVTSAQSVAFGASLLPCVLFVALGLPRLSAAELGVTAGAVEPGALLSWVIWLYSGFTSLGSMAGEVAEPELTYVK